MPWHSQGQPRPIAIVFDTDIASRSNSINIILKPYTPNHDYSRLCTDIVSRSDSNNIIYNPNTPNHDLVTFDTDITSTDGITHTLCCGFHYETPISVSAHIAL